jgi:hypothetical protein
MSSRPTCVKLLAAALLALGAAVATPNAAADAQGIAAGGPPAGELTAVVSPAEMPLGGLATVSGAVRETGASSGGVPLELQGDQYPYRGFADLARTVTLADGSFSFPPLRPDRNERLRVLGDGGLPLTSAVLAVTVDPRVSLSARSLGPGRTLLSLRVRHVRLGGSAPVSVRWFVRALAARVFRQAGVTAARELRPGLLVASAVVDPPSRRFSYRVCLNPPWEAAMGPGGAHGACPRQDFTLRAGDARSR